MNARYEVLFIARPDIGEAGVKEQVDRARQTLEQRGATGIQVHDWGMRDLAYRIQTHRRGWYVLFEYEAPPDAVAELERVLKLSENVLRFITVRQSETGAPPPYAGEVPEGAESSSELDGGDLQHEQGEGDV